jgi:hypothetical protein
MRRTVFFCASFKEIVMFWRAASRSASTRVALIQSVNAVLLSMPRVMVISPVRLAPGCLRTISSPVEETCRTSTTYFPSSMTKVLLLNESPVNMMDASCCSRLDDQRWFPPAHHVCLPSMPRCDGTRNRDSWPEHSDSGVLDSRFAHDR